MRAGGDKNLCHNLLGHNYVIPYPAKRGEPSFETPRWPETPTLTQLAQQGIKPRPLVDHKGRARIAGRGAQQSMGNQSRGTSGEW